MPAPSLEQEIEHLVLEQIRTFKQSAKMDTAEIFEYHLRHYQIMLLYMEKDLISRVQSTARKGSMSSSNKELRRA